MPNIDKKTQWKDYFFWCIVASLSIGTVVFTLFPLQCFQESWRNKWLSDIIQQTIGISAVLLLVKRFKIRLFCRIERWIFILPCIIIAVNNFPFFAYFSGKMQLYTNELLDFVLFGLHCISVGLFEEVVFRGVIFYFLASYFSKDKKGLIKTVVFSSILFGVSHLLNIFAGANVGATLLQVGYTVLTGGLFAFAFIQTKNILIPAFIHATYNFCGLLFEIPARGGLGTGVVFDVGTICTMATVCVVVGVIIMYYLVKYPENERKTLYNRLSV